MNNNIKILNILMATFLLGACTQYTPSAMNASPIQVSTTTMMEQIALKDINHDVIFALADHYNTNGTSPLELIMTFDPNSKSFTAMNAVHRLNHIKNHLRNKGVKNIKAKTKAVPSGMASLLVSYDMVQALAPTGCQVLPGVGPNRTTRFIGDYQFGCTIDTMTANQIAHPSDLLGQEYSGPSEGRRAATVTESYNAGVPREPLVAPATETINITTN